MSTFAIGDIHGCRKSLEQLLGAFDLTPTDEVVLLGDYVDRGDDSKGVLDCILELGQAHQVVALRGNHEVMMLEARQYPLKAQLWSSYGGFETLISYGAERSEDWAAKIPEAHWDFLNSTRRSYEAAERIFVHGKLDAERELVDQVPYTMIWGKCYDMKPHCSGKPVVCGHTPQPGGRPGVFDWGICLDTGACKGGWLTGLQLETGVYWQVNEGGDIRMDSVETENECL